MKIIELELLTAHLPTVRHFYTNVLGFKQTDQDENSFTLAAGATKLIFRQSSTRPEGPYHFAFRVPFQSFDEVCKELQERVKTLPDPGTGEPIVIHEEWQAKAVYFLDPEGNIVEFIAHQSITGEEEAGSENGVVSVCEIGLPVPYVPAFAEELKDKLKLTRWKSGYEKFEAVGDAHGLFILAEENRNWFPTQLGAVSLPVTVTVSTPQAASIRFKANDIKPLVPEPAS